MVTAAQKITITLCDVSMCPNDFQLGRRRHRRGPGKRKKKVAKKKPRKRSKFGDTEDDDDEAWVPKGARTTGKSWRNPVSGKWEWIPIPPSVYGIELGMERGRPPVIFQ